MQTSPYCKILDSITVSAPGKLMLLGEHAVVYDRPCLVTALNRRVPVHSAFLHTPIFQLDAPAVNVRGYQKPLIAIGHGAIPKGAKFVELATKTIIDTFSFPKLLGIHIFTQSDCSSHVGFGSSSATTVSTIKALSELLRLHLDNTTIFRLAYSTVLDIQGKGSGYDVAAALYGGTLYFVTGGKIIYQLPLTSLPLIVAYSGVKADTVAQIDRVLTLFSNKQSQLRGIFDHIATLVDLATHSLLEGNWAQFGNLMNRNHDYLRKLGVTNNTLDAMVESALSAGAYGAKLSGAGGGDCIIAIGSRRNRCTIENAIRNAGGEIITVYANADGLKLE